MPTSYSDQFFEIDPFSPPPRGTPLTFVRMDLVDTDDDGFFEPNVGETLNGIEITAVYEGDTVRIRVPGTGNITYTGTTFYLADGTQFFTPTDGQVLQNGVFRNSSAVTGSTSMPASDLGPTCFTPGTMIDTPNGLIAIEMLRVGDLVETMDDGAQPIRLIVRGTFRATEEFAPIRFAKGVLGNDKPLLVSPQHRMLITGWQAELLYAQEEVLVAAKHLVNDDTITRKEGGMVEYIHLLFDNHQIVFGAGVPSESYYPQHAASTQDQATMCEVLTLFPELAEHVSDNCQTVRPVLRRFEAALLAA